MRTLFLTVTNMEQELLAVVKRLEAVALKLEKSSPGGPASGKFLTIIMTGGLTVEATLGLVCMACMVCIRHLQPS